MKHRATKDGMIEKEISTFRSYFAEHLRQATRERMNGALDESLSDSAEGTVYMISMTMNRHSYRLAKC